MTDKEMTDRLLARDESVLSEIDCQLGGMITRVALNITGDPRDAEEIRYDVLRKLWESIPPACPGQRDGMGGDDDETARDKSSELREREEAPRNTPA